MKHWFKDRHLRSLIKNSSYLAASKAVAGVAALTTLAFAGRGLGLALFGVLVVIHSYVQAASGITKFQSWQLIVHYAGDVQAGGDQSRFKEAIGFAFALDVTSGLVGMVAAILLLPVLGSWFGVPPNYVLAAMIYCTLLPTMAAATPNGVLRALDRFDLISWQGTISPITRALLSAIAFLLDAPFEAFLAIWFVTDVGGDLFLWFLAARELKRRDLLSGIRPTLRPAGLVRPWHFAISVNLTTSLNTAMGPIARLIVAGLLGPAGAALYRVAAVLANSAQKPADLLAKAFYPEVARLDVGSKAPWRLMIRGMLLCLPIGLLTILIVLFAGRWLLDTMFGAEFRGAYAVLLVLMIGSVLTVLSFPLPSMLLALDRPNAALISRSVALILFFAVIGPFCRNWGLVGAGYAFVLSNAVWSLIMAVQLLIQYRRVRRR